MESSIAIHRYCSLWDSTTMNESRPLVDVSNHGGQKGLPTPTGARYVALVPQLLQLADLVV